MYIGSHVSMYGKEYMLGSVKEALSYNANAFMIYTGAPQNTIRKPISELKVDEAHQLMKENGLSLEHVIVHAPYIMNLANPDPKKQQHAIDFFTEEVKRTYAMGSKIIVLHPGAHLKEGPEVGIARIINGLNIVIENTKDLDVVIALETMAGKGTEVGRNFYELKQIIDGISDESRIGVCFDTCHTHDAGYLVKDDFDFVIKEFDNIIGIDKIKVFHINDSKNELGASKDRHENIGLGYIGFKALSYVVHHPLFKDIPKILETPYITKDDNSTIKELAPYKVEIEMFRNNEYIDNYFELIRYG